MLQVHRLTKVTVFSEKFSFGDIAQKLKIMGLKQILKKILPLVFTISKTNGKILKKFTIYQFLLKMF